MDTFVSSLSKNISAWGRKFVVRAADGATRVGTLAAEGSNIWVGKIRVVVSDTLSVTLDSLRSRR